MKYLHPKEKLNIFHEKKICFEHGSPEKMPTPVTLDKELIKDESIDPKIRAAKAKEEASNYIRQAVDAGTRLKLSSVSEKGKTVSIEEKKQRDAMAYWQDLANKTGFHLAGMAAIPVMPLEKQPFETALYVLSKNIQETCRNKNLDDPAVQMTIKQQLYVLINSVPDTYRALSSMQFSYDYQGHTLDLNFMPEGVDVNIRKTGIKKNQ